MVVRPMAAAATAVALLACVAASAPSKASAQSAPADPVLATWRIDPTHSELSFRIRHLISRVRGSFDEWGGTVVADADDLAGGSVEVAIHTRSINTRNERRDSHLRENDFFDADRYPQITFRSTRVETDGQSLNVHGELTIRDVSRPVVLTGRFLGLTRDGQGRTRMGFEAATTIDRHDFGVSWNNIAEGGGLVLGDEVTISIVIAAVRH